MIASLTAGVKFEAIVFVDIGSGVNSIKWALA
jgi:hypothetical protein